jgi:hypothetical protein
MIISFEVLFSLASFFRYVFLSSVVGMVLSDDVVLELKEIVTGFESSFDSFQPIRSSRVQYCDA